MEADIEWVTLAGVTAQVQSVSGSTQVVVVAGASSSGALSGDVVVYSSSYGETVASNAFEYLRASQAPLLFAPPSPQTYNTTRPLSATGGSGTGAVSYVISSGPGTIVDDTNLLVTAGAGTVTVVATKAQDDRYVATSATGTVTAAKAAQTITFPNPGLQVVTNETPITATASSGLSVSLSVVSGAEHLTGPIGPISPTSLTYQSPGQVTLRATQTGNENWQAAAAVEITFRVRADRVPYADFDGDGRSDLTVFYPAEGMWHILESERSEQRDQNWGWHEAVPVPGDYDGDGKIDISVYYPDGGMWYILESATGAMRQQNWGWNETVPVWPWWQ